MGDKENSLISHPNPLLPSRPGLQVAKSQSSLEDDICDIFVSVLYIEELKIQFYSYLLTMTNLKYQLKYEAVYLGSKAEEIDHILGPFLLRAQLAWLDHMSWPTY